MAKDETTVVEPTAAPQVEGEVQTNTARRQDLVDAYYNTEGGASVGEVAAKHNVRVSDVYAALRDAATDNEAKADLDRAAQFYSTRGE